MSTNSVNPLLTLPWAILLYGKYAKEDEVYQSSQNGSCCKCHCSTSYTADGDLYAAEKQTIASNAAQRKANQYWSVTQHFEKLYSFYTTALKTAALLHCYTWVFGDKYTTVLPIYAYNQSLVSLNGFKS
uniref:Uncharacterized protein n=1 Tax=Glossina pallidipes TaxID=7398 RepID=A0A1A9ZBK7_GLOPL